MWCLAHKMQQLGGSCSWRVFRAHRAPCSVLSAWRGAVGSLGARARRWNLCGLFALMGAGAEAQEGWWFHHGSAWLVRLQLNVG